MGMFYRYKNVPLGVFTKRPTGLTNHFKKVIVGHGLVDMLFVLDLFKTSLFTNAELIYLI